MKTQTINLDVKASEGYRHIQESVEWISEDTAIIKLRFEKIQPRRIVLEETDEDHSDISFHDSTGTYTYWCEVKETDIPLTNDEPKLSLSANNLLRLKDVDDNEMWDVVNDFIMENS